MFGFFPDWKWEGIDFLTPSSIAKMHFFLLKVSAKRQLFTVLALPRLMTNVHANAYLADIRFRTISPVVEICAFVFDW